MTIQAASVETPSGKDAAYENFPVGSFLLPARLRSHIAVFYRFARAIDDIADGMDISPDEKIVRLRKFEEAVTGVGAGAEDPAYETGHRMRRSLLEMGVTAQHCVDLIDAFKQDAVKGRTADWDDLMRYCIRSAAPVGRYLIDLHGGSEDGYGPSDALCSALQVINHLQDCREDYREMDRVYLPSDWLADAGTCVEALEAPRASREIRRVLDRCLDGTESLLREAEALPTGVCSKRLAIESAAIIEIAWALAGKLRREDPLAGRVALSKAGYAWCAVKGVMRVLLGLKPARR